LIAFAGSHSATVTSGGCLDSRKRSQALPSAHDPGSSARRVGAVPWRSGERRTQEPSEGFSSGDDVSREAILVADDDPGELACLAAADELAELAVVSRESAPDVERADTQSA
jgi:hypothetical protein